MRSTTLFIATALVLSSGCGDAGTDVDSGVHITLDGSADTGVDAGGPDLGDDLGPADMGLTGVCAQPIMPLPAANLPRCTAATKACFDACPVTSATCGSACLSADTTPSITLSGQTVACSQCFGYQEFACFDANMCHDAVAALNCCIQAHCMPATTACAMSMCSTEYTGLQTCAGAHARSCVTSGGQYVMDCFAAPVDGGTMGDASTSDAGTDDAGTVMDAGTTTADAGGD